MQIHNITLNNFKVYLGQHTIDWSIKNLGKPVVLIGGVTGAGKTSILEAVKLCLFGRNNKQMLKGYNSYNQFLFDVHNKQARKKKKAFSISIDYTTDKIRDIDLYTIERKWSMKNDDTYHEDLSLLINNIHREYLHYDDFQNHINENFPPGIGDLLFFDSEIFNKIPDFLENGFIGSLNKFMGIDKYDQLYKDLIKYKRSHIIKNDPELADQLLEIQERLKKVEEEIHKKEENKYEIHTQINDFEKERDKIKGELQKQSGQLSLFQQKIIEEKIQLRQLLKQKKDEYKNIFSELVPFSLANELCQLLINQLYEEQEIKEQRIIRNKIKKIENNFINDLNNDFSKDDIIKIKQKFKSQLNFSKANKKVLHDVSITESKVVISELTKILKIGKREKEKINAGLNRLTDALSQNALKEKTINSKGPGEILFLKLNDLNRHIDNDREHVNKLKDDVGQLVKEKEYLLVQDNSLQNKSILEKLEAKKLDVLNNTMNMLLEFSSHLSKSRFSNLRKEFISTIQKLATKEDLVNDIFIDQKNKKMHFLNKNGNRLSVKDFSAGESELIAFSLIWAVNISSNAFYPIITDSPFNRLDSEHRINFIDNIIKKANNQIIFLSTNEEISNLEQYGIKPYISKNYLIKYNKKSKTSSFKTTYFN